MSAFLHADDFLEEVIAWRSIWFSGRLGSGKTLCAVALAQHLGQAGLIKGVWSNFPVALPARRELTECAFLIDEAWQVMDARLSRTQQTLYGAWARKLGSFWLFPSIFPPDNRVRLVTVERVWQLLIGPEPIWFYNYITFSDDKGWFVLRPKMLFGQFDTGYIPSDDGGISDKVRQFIKEAGIKLQSDKD